MAFSIIYVCHRCVVIDEIPVCGTTSGSCDVVWKFDNVVVFDVMDDICSSVTLYAVPT